MIKALEAIEWVSRGEFTMISIDKNLHAEFPLYSHSIELSMILVNLRPRLSSLWLVLDSFRSIDTISKRAMISQRK